MNNFINELVKGVYVENVRSHFDCSTKMAELALKLAVTQGLMTSEIELTLDSGQVIARYLREEEIPEKVKYYTYQDCTCNTDELLSTDSDGYDEFVVLNTSKLRKMFKFYAIDAASAFEFVAHLSVKI